MSKSPNSNIFIPALGGAALILGVAYGVSTTNYGKDRIETLEASFAKERAVATEQAARAGALETSLSELQASSEAHDLHGDRCVPSLLRVISVAIKQEFI